MEFVENLVDYGEAPEFHATGIGSASRISAGTVRITLYDARECQDGTIERRIAAYVLCDVETLTGDAATALRELIAVVGAMIPLNERGRHLRAGAH